MEGKKERDLESTFLLSQFFLLIPAASARFNNSRPYLSSWHNRQCGGAWKRGRKWSCGEAGQSLSRHRPRDIEGDKHSTGISEQTECLRRPNSWPFQRSAWHQRELLLSPPLSSEG